MSDAFICDAVRTPMGRHGGLLSSMRADDLAAVPLSGLIARNAQIDWLKVDDLIYGCANQAGEDNRNVGCMAVLLSGLPRFHSRHHRQPSLRLRHGCCRHGRARYPRERPRFCHCRWYREHEPRAFRHAEGQGIAIILERV